jgi:hypothetical protein
MNDEASGALKRVARGIGGTEVIDRLAALSGSDFASVMLEVARRRAARETPASVRAATKEAAGSSRPRSPGSSASPWPGWPLRTCRGFRWP